MNSEMESTSSAPDLLTSAYRWLYYGIQRIRRGVSPAQVEHASQLLDAPQDVLQDHIETRLQETHGAGNAARQWLSRQEAMERDDVFSDPAYELPWIQRFRRFERKKTSGSTGQPLRICKDMRMAARIDATMWALYRWHGIYPGLSHARFWGLSSGGWQRYRARILDCGLRRHRLSAFEFDRSAVRWAFHRLRSHQPQYIHAYPSLADEFVRICSDEGLDGADLGVRVLFLTGELLTDDVRSRIESYFQARVVNEYGCTESGLLAFECEQGGMHLVSIATLMEVAQISGDGPPTRALSGEVLITDLYGTHRPFLRYRLGDRATIQAERSCNCGRNLPLVQIGDGRTDAFIAFPNGERLFCSILSRSMPQGVRRFRAVQPNLESLHIDIELHSGALTVPTVAALRRALESYIKGRIQVEISVVHVIEPEPSGKLRYFIPLADQVSR